MKYITFLNNKNKVWYLDATNISYCELLKLKEEVNDSNFKRKIDDYIVFKSLGDAEKFLPKKPKKIKKKMHIKERRYLND